VLSEDASALESDDQPEQELAAVEGLTADDADLDDDADDVTDDDAR
jgi:hypothetical protein